MKSSKITKKIQSYYETKKTEMTESHVLTIIIKGLRLKGLRFDEILNLIYKELTKDLINIVRASKRADINSFFISKFLRTHNCTYKKIVELLQSTNPITNPLDVIRALNSLGANVYWINKSLEPFYNLSLKRLTFLLFEAEMDPVDIARFIKKEVAPDNHELVSLLVYEGKVNVQDLVIILNNMFSYKKTYGLLLYFFSDLELSQSEICNILFKNTDIHPTKLAKLLRDRKINSMPLGYGSIASLFGKIGINKELTKFALNNVGAKGDDLDVAMIYYDESVIINLLNDPYEDQVKHFLFEILGY